MKLTSACVITVCLSVPPPLFAQQRDSTRADTTRTDTTAARVLPPIEVVGSILPAAGPTIGSGVTSRIATLDAGKLDE
jgi:hypothetical protein